MKSSTNTDTLAPRTYRIIPTTARRRLTFAQCIEYDPTQTSLTDRNSGPTKSNDQFYQHTSSAHRRGPPRYHTPHSPSGSHTRSGAHLFPSRTLTSADESKNHQHRRNHSVQHKKHYDTLPKCSQDSSAPKHVHQGQQHKHDKLNTALPQKICLKWAASHTLR